VFRKETYARLLRNFDVTANPHPQSYATKDVEDSIADFDGLVTGWGTPKLSEKVFRKGKRLKIIAHSAGSVKGMFTEETVEKYLKKRDICVFSANGAIALNVAEHAVGALIMMSRHWMRHALNIRETGMWRDSNLPATGQYLRGATVGIVSASKVGREVIKLLQPFDVKILVYDPYLSDYEAGRLGVEKVKLNDLFSRSDFVTVHAPNIPATRRMIKRQHLKLLRDGGVFVNTSRGAVLDHDALYQEAKTGRIQVQLDVTDPEPLPPDHPLRSLPNVVITPHTSGAGNYGYFTIGDTTAQALEDFFAGKPVVGQVRLDDWARLA
jgi:phosphoglycerate dehydrogenase-like enzyme